MTGERVKRPFTGIRAYTQELTWLTRGTDAVCVWAALSLSVWSHGHEWHRGHILAATVAMGLLAFCAEHAALYRSWRSTPLREEFVAIAIAWGCVIVAMLLLGYTTKTTHLYSRLVLGTWFLGTTVLLAGWRGTARLALRVLRARGYNTRTVAIAGNTEMAARAVETIAGSPWMGLQLVGIFDDRQIQRDGGHVGPAVSPAGPFDTLVAAARSGKIDVIYLTLPLSATQRLQELVGRLSDATASVYIIPDLFASRLFRARWVHVGDLPVVSIYETPFYGVNGWVKRVEDLVLAGLILPVIALPMLIIALAISLTCPGPVIFTQRRYGLDGHPFRIWKFRTMRVQEDADEVSQATRDDPRVTRVGAFLRRYSLDELPQFLNVLEGTMSVVGPRPHAVVHNERYRTMIQGYMLRHKVKPGITGWAQVNGWRGEVDCPAKMQRRLEHDLWYINNWSLLLDLKIVGLTALGSFRSVEAY